jgi:hypothetical protein
MVFATKENYENINRVVELTCLSREQVVQAMSNERKRLKAQGTTVEELNAIKENGRLGAQLKDLRVSLQDCIDRGHCPPGLHDEVKDVAQMMVWRPCSSCLCMLLTAFRKKFFDCARSKGRWEFGAEQGVGISLRYTALAILSRRK